ncbi:MAG: M3 family metallopeptidase [Salibacteraceae bacterium]
MNPFLEDFATPFESIPFKKIKNEYFLPALDALIEENRKEIDKICQVANPSFSNVIEALENSGRKLGTLSSTFFNLNSAETSDEIEKIAETFSPTISAFGNEVSMNEMLFKKVKTVYNNTDKNSLSVEQNTLLSKTYKRFARNGGLADAATKEEIKKVDEKLSKLKVQFGQNVLHETNAFELIAENESDLAGLPDYAIEAAAQTAKENNKEGKWVFNLQYPSYVPFMTYADNGDLRKQMFMAFAKRGYQNNENNNQDIVIEIANLRLKRAQLLGYKSHAHFVLEERMAKTTDTVQDFLHNLIDKSLNKAKEQINEVAVYASEKGAKLPLQRWDFNYWSEKLKKEKYDFDDSVLKPYFKLENVIEGSFLVAKKLYGLTFKVNNEIDKYHSDVKVYEVYDEQENFVSLFYADFHPRKGKRPGAWMTSYKGQFVENGKEQRPHISIVCNFSKPTETEPSLLTFMEVKTLFHEFGHALHGMLAKGNYESLSGTNVFWDFVELPSQVLENWCYEKECLDLFAKHYKTGELIPSELIQKLSDSAKYLEAYATIRQLNFGMLDMTWHGTEKEITESLPELEERATSKTALFPHIAGTASSTAFAHIFSGGYSSGYYSYKWAEVLDADAFEAFKEKGIFNREVADAFRKNILEKGGSEHPMELYKKFRGHEPKADALLKRAGLD